MTSLDEVFVALHQVALRARGGISGIAGRLGKRQQVLINKLNPADDVHQPTLGEFSAVMSDTGDTLPLELLCAVHGGRFVTRTTERCASVLEAVLLATREHGDVARVIEEAARDGVIDDRERVRIRREVAELRRALAVLENTLEMDPGRYE